MKRGHKPLRSAEQNRARKRAQEWMLLPERQPCPTPHKHAFPGKKEAKAALSKLKGLGHARSHSLHVYRCQCNRWHLGTIPNGLRNGNLTRAETNAIRPA